MRKLMFVAIAIAGLAVGAGYAQEMPPEVRAILDNYVADSAAPFSPSRLRENGWIPDTIEFSDLRLRVLQLYVVRRELQTEGFDAYPDTVPFRALIRPTGGWRVLVTAHNNPLYELIFGNNNGIWGFYSGRRVSATGDALWRPLLETYPESTGINPVSVSTPTSGGGVQRFLYFEQLGPRKIYFVSAGNERGHQRLAELLPGSIETLNDSKVLIAHWREHGIPRGGGLINDLSTSPAQRTVEGNNADASANERTAPTWSNSVLHEPGSWQSNPEGGRK